MSDGQEISPDGAVSQGGEESKARREFLKKVAAGTVSGATIAPAVAMLMTAATAQAQDGDPYSQGGGNGCGCGCGCGSLP